MPKCNHKTKIKKYCKRSILVEAAQFDGTTESIKTISRWPEAVPKPDIKFVTPDINGLHATDVTLFTSNGGVNINPGDWIIKGIQGEFYRCEPEVFNLTYGTAQNMLISEDFRKEMASVYHHFDEARRTGRSYGQALAIISSAMQRPGTPVNIIDHSGTKAGNRETTSQVFDILEKLQLKNFKIERIDFYKFCLIYEIFKAENKE